MSGLCVFERYNNVVIIILLYNILGPFFKQCKVGYNWILQGALKNELAMIVSISVGSGDRGVRDKVRG